MGFCDVSTGFDGGPGEHEAKAPKHPRAQTTSTDEIRERVGSALSAEARVIRPQIWCHQEMSTAKVVTVTRMQTS